MMDKQAWIVGVVVPVVVALLAVVAAEYLRLALDSRAVTENYQGGTDEPPALLLPDPIAPPEGEPPLPPPPPETRERSFNVNFWNDFCNGPRTINWRINADEGWRILVGTIEPTAYPDSDSTFEGIANETAEGFNLIGRLVNGGEGCGPFGLWRDSRGHMRIRGTYIEERIQ